MPKAHRGEVWQIDLGLVGKVRPAVVVNVEFADAERALYALVAHTTSVRGTRFEIRVDVPGLQPGAFDVQQLVTLPEPKLLRRRAILTAEQMRQLEEVLSLWFGLHR
jgi:mRNA interferase MazF